MSGALTAADLLATEVWRSWSPEQKRHLLAKAGEVQAAQRRNARDPYPWQRPHAHPADWPLNRPCDDGCLAYPDLPPLAAHDTWLLIGGRGIGKTDGSAMYVLDHVNGPPCDPKIRGGHRLAIIAPTLGDAVESCVNGPSGLAAYDPRVRAVGAAGGTFVRFPNGAQAKLFGAHTENDVQRLRAGGNRCLVWLEEAAAMRYLGIALEQSAMGLRVGPRPHYVASTTPKIRPEIKAWLHDPKVHVTMGRTRDATHLAAEVRDALYAKHLGTRSGLQELDGLLLEDVDGALWRSAMIDQHRVGESDVRAYQRIVVAVDPNAGGPDECGIVVVGLERERRPDKTGRLRQHVYVLADESDHYPHPGAWAAAAVRAYHRWQADAIVAEVNNGGDMVPHTIRTVDATVRCRSVTATRGKAVRAEPVVALYEQEAVHHVGIFPRLEEQQTTWTPDSDDSPDRMDALVWGITELAVKGGGGFASAA